MPEPAGGSEFTAAALLPALIEAFRERDADRLPTEEVVAALSERLGRPVTANRLARTLKPCGVAPRQFRLSGERAWGYRLQDIAEASGPAPSGESRDASIRAGDDARDPAAEWALRVAMAGMVRW